MLFKILGFLDVLAGISLVLLNFNLFRSLALVFGFYLLLKSLPFLFTRDLASYIDFFAGLFILSAFYFSFPYLFFGILFGAWLIQKGIFTML